MNGLSAYLKPTVLCDFDRSRAVSEKAMELMPASRNSTETFGRLCSFVRELPYGLEDWDLKASETLAKGWGMCCGKTNLLVALCRACGLPSRYRVFRIRVESKLLTWIAEQQGAGMFGTPPPEQDHLECEAYLDGVWTAFDPSRDSDMERGLVKLEIPLDREMVKGPDGKAEVLVLDCIDDWASKRQEIRRFREEREALFAIMNHQLDKLRTIGRGET